MQTRSEQVSKNPELHMLRCSSFIIHNCGARPIQSHQSSFIIINQYCPSRSVSWIVFTVVIGFNQKFLRKDHFIFKMTLVQQAISDFYCTPKHFEVWDIDFRNNWKKTICTMQSVLSRHYKLYLILFRFQVHLISSNRMPLKLEYHFMEGNSIIIFSFFLFDLFLQIYAWSI